MGYTKPNHYLEMAKVLGENRDQLAYAWRILNDGCCDGCALRTVGLRERTIDGIHMHGPEANFLIRTGPLRSELRRTGR